MRDCPGIFEIKLKIWHKFLSWHRIFLIWVNSAICAIKKIKIIVPLYVIK